MVCPGVTQTLQLAELSREKLLEEIGGLNKDRGDLIEQLGSVSPEGGVPATDGTARMLQLSTASDLPSGDFL